MSPVRSVSERLAFNLLKLAAHVMMIAGVAMVVPSLALRTMGEDGEPAAAIARAGQRFSAIFLAAGVASLYLVGSRRRIFPNEGEPPGTDRTVGGWLVLLALTLVALPLWLFTQSAPLMSISNDIIAFLGEQGVWQAIERDSQFSGLILMPVVAVLGVPFLEAGATVSFLGGSAILLVLMMVRSRRFPRAFLMCVLMQGALVIASAYGMRIVAHVSPFIERAVTEGSTASTAQQRRALEEIQRYQSVVRATAVSLMWTWSGYLVWTPALFLSDRIRTTFAVVQPASIAAPLIDRIPTQDRFRRGDYQAAGDESRARYYEEAARKLDASGPAPRTNQAALFAFAIVAGLFAAYLVYVVMRILR